MIFICQTKTFRYDWEKSIEEETNGLDAHAAWNLVEMRDGEDSFVMRKTASFLRCCSIFNVCRENTTIGFQSFIDSHTSIYLSIPFPIKI